VNAAALEGEINAAAGADDEGRNEDLKLIWWRVEE
jgi:hypothetical protein